MTLVSVQGFGIAAPGGGSRILRALFEVPPMPVLAVCSAPVAPPSQALVTEEHVPLRPYFGRLESTRVRPYLDSLDSPLGPSFRRHLAAICQRHAGDAVHAVAMGLTFWHAFVVARKCQLPYFLTVHDDYIYTMQGGPGKAASLRRLGTAWRDAHHRYVISTALGDEYAHRYGHREYSIVTDGIHAPPPQRQLRDAAVRVYFAGAVHISYGRNLRALLAALDELDRQGSMREISFTARCGQLGDGRLRSRVPIQVLPFADEQTVARDLDGADLLYLPLPFGERYHRFTKYSLSTKLITYLGSGVPILYHGPLDTPVARLLREHAAAILTDTLEPADIAQAIRSGLPRRSEFASNAGRLATRDFRLETQRGRFWSPIETAI